MTGIGRTKIDLRLIGPDGETEGIDGLAVGPVLSSIPVPEPSGLVSGLSALVALAGLRRLRNRHSAADC